MKIWKSIYYILGVIPWTFIVSLLTFYFKAGQVLGHTPSYNNPDPKELVIYKVYAPYIDWTLEIWLYSFVVWLLLTTIYFISRRKRIEWSPIIISGIGQILVIFLLLSGIFEWYVD